MLESEKLFVPGFPVWKQLIVTSAMGARDNELRWNFVARAFRCLSSSEPSFWPDHVLLKHGLEASNVLFNAELASDLIRRAVENYRAPRVSRLFKTAIDKSSLHTGSGLQVPLNDIAKAMNICLRAGNMVACGKILSCVDKPELGARNMSFLYLLSLKGYANAGDSSSAEKIIMNMQEKNIQPG